MSSMLKPGQLSLLDSEFNETITWYRQGDTTLGLDR